MDDLKYIFFDDSVSSGKAKYLSENLEQAIEWEAVSVSDFSPGVVNNCENISRQIHSPIHYDDQTGDIKTAAFDDALNKGLSINRLSYVAVNQLHLDGEKKAERDRIERGRPERQYLGLITAKVEVIRGMFEDGQRQFGVYDTGLSSSPDHADICALHHGRWEERNLPKKPAKMARKRRLQSVFGALLRPEQVE